MKACSVCYREHKRHSDLCPACGEEMCAHIDSKPERHRDPPGPSAEELDRMWAKICGQMDDETRRYVFGN